MGTVITAEISEEAKRDKRGRKIIPEARWREFVAAYEASGLTQAKFARQEGINYCTFVAWLGRCRRHPTSATATVPRFLEARLPLAHLMARRLEVLLPSGLVVRGDEAAAVAEVVKALGT
jgi:hypothetical protein